VVNGFGVKVEMFSI